MKLLFGRPDIGAYLTETFATQTEANDTHDERDLDKSAPSLSEVSVPTIDVERGAGMSGWQVIARCDLLVCLMTVHNILYRNLFVLSVWTHVAVEVAVAPNVHGVPHVWSSAAHVLADFEKYYCTLCIVSPIYNPMSQASTPLGKQILCKTNGLNRCLVAPRLRRNASGQYWGSIVQPFPQLGYVGHVNSTRSTPFAVRPS